MPCHQHLQYLGDIQYKDVLLMLPGKLGGSLEVLPIFGWASSHVSGLTGSVLVSASAYRVALFCSISYISYPPAVGPVMFLWLQRTAREHQKTMPVGPALRTGSRPFHLILSVKANVMAKPRVRAGWAAQNYKPKGVHIGNGEELGSALQSTIPPRA